VITGSPGRYNPSKGSYLPPEGYSSWSAYADKKGIQFSGSMFVIQPDGQKLAFSELPSQTISADMPEIEAPAESQDESEGYQARTTQDNVDENRPVRQEESFFPSMQILGGFVAVLGIAAVAVSLTILSMGLAAVIGVSAAASLAAVGIGSGASAAILGGSGLAATLAGTGLFANSGTSGATTGKENKPSDDNPEPDFTP